QTLHPVAGQGFNLALRDVWALAETLLRKVDSHAFGAHGEKTCVREDIGRAEVLAAYA
ncbi:MAG TPA: 2-octaprenyl-6-methoxyphenyl hydroxylase, partial [Thauera sp.]|nr:2-octaprenyl-6-methoxyphenyl hydroxylase [Thauera sp.]